MSISMIGLDTAKSVFQIHGVNETGKLEIKRKLRRSELSSFFEKQESCTVVMEACGAAHHWARILTGLGHTVKLIAAEAVKPFVKKGKKNDAADAAAICEAASRPDAKFMPGQDRTAAGHPGLACGSIAVGQAADDASERHAWPGHGIRRHRSKRHTKTRRTDDTCRRGQEHSQTGQTGDHRTA